MGKKRVFPGVEIHIGTQRKELKSICGPVIFKLSGNSIVAVSFENNSGEAGEKIPEVMRVSAKS
jgi:hypothetical protein